MTKFVPDRQNKVLELLDTSGPGLHALLVRLALSQDVVGDLMQELFIRLSNSSGFDKAKDPYAYACRVAMNLAFEWRRKTKVKIADLNENSFLDEDNASPLEEIVKAEEFAEVLDAMSQLNDLAREVIVMHYIEQQSYDEIALHLNKKPQHIRSVSAKGLARLRSLLTSKVDLQARSES